jgi:hypothetical protein
MIFCDWRGGFRSMLWMATTEFPVITAISTSGRVIVLPPIRPTHRPLSPRRVDGAHPLIHLSSPQSETIFEALIGIWDCCGSESILSPDGTTLCRARAAGDSRSS